jgi:6-phosphogluconate dehydrogenase
MWQGEFFDDIVREEYDSFQNLNNRKETMPTAQIGVIGLGTMGANLARNFASKGFATAVFNRSYERTAEFLKEHGEEKLLGFEKLEDFVTSLELPRRIVLMVTAGPAIDEVMKTLQPFMSKGDVVIDGGNSFFEDTERRAREWSGQGINFVGCGISGGEEGALHGPSIMPGGSAEAWTALKPLLEKIAARDFEGGACVTHVGQGGSGHYVKMVHNGIEYAMMQLIAEIYDFNRKIGKKTAAEIAEVFEKIQAGPAQGFLTEITIPVLKRREGEDFLVNKVLDKAAQKGTGTWTGMEGLKKGVPISAISEAVFARGLSAQKEMREKLSEIYKKPLPKEAVEMDYGNIMLFGMLIAYAQGLHLIAQASKEYNWQIDLAEVARIWQGGCIIRSILLKEIRQAFQKNSGLSHLLEDQQIAGWAMNDAQLFRKFVLQALQDGIALPVSASMMAYFDGITEENSPANLIQGLRDFFGAHTFERVDKPGIFHENWN